MSLNVHQRDLLRIISFLFLLSGLAGLFDSAIISTYYLDTLPTMPVPAELRMTPRNIHGTVVYQTEDEGRRLTVIEVTSVGVFLVGLGLGFVYLRKWGIAQAISSEEDEYESESV